MKQPTKDVLREQLALAADEIIRLKTALVQSVDLAHGMAERLHSARAPWWRRLLGWLL